jgi:hypothetical protein
MMRATSARPAKEVTMMLKKNPRRRVRCPHCSVMCAEFDGDWCDDCTRQGDLPLIGDLTGHPPSSIEPPSTVSTMIPDAFSRPTGSREGLETATGDVSGAGAPNTAGVACGALLRVDGKIVWRCNHLHRTLEGALACASRETARREREPALACGGIVRLKAEEEQ